MEIFDAVGVGGLISNTTWVGARSTNVYVYGHERRERTET